MSRPGALALFLARLLLASVAFAALPFSTSQAAIILTTDDSSLPDESTGPRLGDGDP